MRESARLGCKFRSRCFARGKFRILSKPQLPYIENRCWNIHFKMYIPLLSLSLLSVRMILAACNTILDHGITNAYMCYLIRWSVPRMEQQLNSIGEGSSFSLPPLLCHPEQMLPHGHKVVAMVPDIRSSPKNAISRKEGGGERESRRSLSSQVSLFKEGNFRLLSCWLELSHLATIRPITGREEKDYYD